MGFWPQFWAKYRAPLVLLALVLFLASAFRSVVLPFLVAIFIAYLIEPVVSWISQRRVRGRSIPRGASVLIVYSGALLVTGAFVFGVGPQLVREVGSLAREAPEFFRQLRSVQLPAINARIERMLTRSEPALDEARDHVHEALAQASLRIDLFSQLHDFLTPEERERIAISNLESRTLDADEQAQESVFLRLRPEPDGTFAVLLTDGELLIERSERGDFHVRRRTFEPNLEPTGRLGIDLGKLLDESLASLAERSGAAVTDIITFMQRMLSGLASVLMSILVTFMVAAFISIDTPAIVRFLRSLFPESSQQSVGQLLTELNRGLSGVIRGQLLICLVNGILTGIGLVVLDVKFAFVLAVLAGVLSLIPVFGTIISTIPCVLIGLTNSFMTGLLVLLWILGIHFIEGNMLNPKIIGTSARIHPALIIFALLAGEHTYGIIGALIAVPAASVIQTLFLFFKENRWQDAQPLRPMAAADVAAPSEPGSPADEEVR